MGNRGGMCKKIEKSKVVIILNNNYFDQNLKILENKIVVACFSHNCLSISKANIAIPIASFYEKSGTYINFEGKKQKVISKLKKDKPIQTISSIIEHIKSMIDKGSL